MRFNPLYSFFNFFRYSIQSMVTIDISEQEIKLFDDKIFNSFRHILIKKRIKSTPAVFWVRFTLPHSITFDKNKSISSRALPFFCGLPGFREKYWCVHRESNEYLGLYEWQNYKLAKKYSSSFAVKFMTSRAINGSVKWDILDNKTIKKIITEHT